MLTVSRDPAPPLIEAGNSAEVELRVKVSMPPFPTTLFAPVKAMGPPADATVTKLLAAKAQLFATVVTVEPVKLIVSPASPPRSMRRPVEGTTAAAGFTSTVSAATPAPVFTRSCPTAWIELTGMLTTLESSPVAPRRRWPD